MLIACGVDPEFTAPLTDDPLKNNFLIAENNLAIAADQYGLTLERFKSASSYDYREYTISINPAEKIRIIIEWCPYSLDECKKTDWESTLHFDFEYYMDNTVENRQDLEFNFNLLRDLATAVSSDKPDEELFWTFLHDMRNDMLKPAYQKDIHYYDFYSVEVSESEHGICYYTGASDAHGEAIYYNCYSYVQIPSINPNQKDGG